MTFVEVLGILLENFSLDQHFLTDKGMETYQFHVDNDIALWCTITDIDTDIALCTALPNIMRTDTVALQRLLTASAQGRGVGPGSIGYDMFGNVALTTPVRVAAMTKARVVQAIASHLSYVAHWRGNEFESNTQPIVALEEIIMVP